MSCGWVSGLPLLAVACRASRTGSFTIQRSPFSPTLYSWPGSVRRAASCLTVRTEVSRRDRLFEEVDARDLAGSPGEVGCRSLP